MHYQSKLAPFQALPLSPPTGNQYEVINYPASQKFRSMHHVIFPHTSKASPCNFAQCYICDVNSEFRARQHSGKALAAQCSLTSVWTGTWDGMRLASLQFPVLDPGLTAVHGAISQMTDPRQQLLHERVWQLLMDGTLHGCSSCSSCCCC